MFYGIFCKGLYAHFGNDGLGVHIFGHINGEIKFIGEPELLNLQIIGYKSKLIFQSGYQLVVCLQYGTH